MGFLTMSIRFLPVYDTPPPAIKELYEQSFPLYERRPWPQQLELLKQKKIQLLQLEQEGVFAGFIFYWSLSEAILIEHFAIDPAGRGKGAGTHVMQHMATLFNTILLETEPAEAGQDAIRRIHFYEKLGYHMYPFPYQQPPYAAGYPSIAMNLMHNGTPETAPEFTKIQSEIYATVYTVTDK